MKWAAKILVVDDEPLVRQAITKLLQHCGHQVESVENGEAALVCLAQRRFDIVVTDLSMPDMQGDELVARIRQVLPNQLIILSTAFAEEYNMFDQSTRRVDALLLKPFSIDDLNETIERLFAKAPPCHPAMTPTAIKPTVKGQGRVEGR
jgi:two-component system capsular synthesis sensor histidine kinase RcsC